MFLIETGVKGDYIGECFVFLAAVVARKGRAGNICRVG